MAKCPKCKNKLRLVDWRQTCPNCGINLIYYGFEERFYNDAKRSELGFAKLRVFTYPLRASFIGNKFAIARIVFTFLPIAALLIPFGNLIATLPSFTDSAVTASFNINALDVYELFMGSLSGSLNALVSSKILGDAFVYFSYAIYAFIACVFFAALTLIFEIFSFLRGGSTRIIISSVLGIIATIVCIVYTNIFFDRLTTLGMAEIFSVKSGFGGYVLIFTFVLLIIINIIIKKKGIRFYYRNGDRELAQIAKKVKTGTLKLSELEQPIYNNPEKLEEDEAFLR